MWTYNNTTNSDELYHYGVLGMKWGVRRYQNKDGSVTNAGKKRYSDKSPYEVKTADGDTFHVSRGSRNNYNSKKSKVTKTWGQHLYDIDNNKIQKKTEKQQKKVSKKYKKLSSKAIRDFSKKANSVQINAYNKAADHMNNGGIDKFNAQQRKKYGNNYTKRAGYTSDYEKQFNKLVSDNYNKSVNDFLKKNKNYKKAQALVKKYNMTEWNDLVKDNEAVMKKVR